MDEELKQRLIEESTWLRGLYMVLFIIINEITKVLLMAVVVFQFLATLFTSKRNQQLLNFGGSLSAYIYQIVLFLTYNAEEKPFPFSPWPEGGTVSKPKATKKATKKQVKGKAVEKEKLAETEEEKPAESGEADTKEEKGE